MKAQNKNNSTPLASTACNGYVAVFESGGQTGPDSWGNWIETKICDENTTIGEIRDWYFSKHPHADRMTEIKLTQAT